MRGAGEDQRTRRITCGPAKGWIRGWIVALTVIAGLMVGAAPARASGGAFAGGAASAARRAATAPRTSGPALSEDAAEHGEAPAEREGEPAIGGDGEAQIAQARVWLTIYRGGEILPDGRRVSRRGAEVEGVVEYRLREPALPGQRLVLLNFAEAMHHEPVELDEVAIATYLEGPFDRGALVLTGLWGVERSERIGDRRDVVLTLRPGVQEVTLRYTVKVPHRYWPLGCVKRRCSLSGALAPLPSAPARGGRWLPRGRVVKPVRWQLETVAFATPGRARPGASLEQLARAERAPSQGRLLARRPDEIVVIGDDARPRQYPLVLWGPRWRRSRVALHGVELEVLHVKARPSGQVPDETLIQLRRDVPGQALQIGAEAVALLEAVDQAPPPGTVLTIVQGPLRSRVAEPHPDAVMLSDQALEVPPLPRFQKFHQTAIARAILDALLERRFRGTHDPSVDLWLPGMLGFSLTGLWQSTRDQKDEFAGDILRNLTFVPAVDRFLYTQQASFSQAYFRGVEDQMPLRNHPLWFSHALPTGRRLHEKLLDTAGGEAVEAFYQALAAEPRADPVALASRAYGYTLGWFFDQWLGPYPAVDYRVHRVQSEREGEGWRHRITVERVGARPVIEPVQVLAVERGGAQHHLMWNGELAEANENLDTEPARGQHTWELVTARRLKTVRVDPRSRLLQVPPPPRLNVDPRFNDRRPPSFRFLYTGIGYSIAASEFANTSTAAARLNALSGFAAFEASLRRDLRRTGHLRVSRDRETNVGLNTSVNFWFGPKRNNRRRRSRVRLSTSGAWLNRGSLDPRGGVRLIERVVISDDTRRFSLWPEKGRSLAAAVTARQTLRDRAQGRSDDRYDLAVSASWVHLWRLAHDHVLASSLASEIVVPLRGDPEFRSLSRVGGIGGLSGYAADEIFGLAMMLAQLEYRHVYLNDMPLNLGHISFVRSVGGTLFTGVATTSSCESYAGWFGANSWHSHVGYALDSRLSIFGVTPQLFRVDVSVPLVRYRDRVCLDQVFPDVLAERQGLDAAEVGRLLPPFNINVTFAQSF